MKQEHIIQAEQEARQACEGLGFNEFQIQSFVDMHLEGEARRALERELELQSAKRNAALNIALINIAVDPYRRERATEEEWQPPQDPYKPRKSDFEMEEERWDDKRNRGET